MLHTFRQPSSIFHVCDIWKRSLKKIRTDWISFWFWFDGESTFRFRCCPLHFKRLRSFEWLKKHKVSRFFVKGPGLAFQRKPEKKRRDCQHSRQESTGLAVPKNWGSKALTSPKNPQNPQSESAPGDENTKKLHCDMNLLNLLQFFSQSRKFCQNQKCLKICDSISCKTHASTLCRPAQEKTMSWWADQMYSATASYLSRPKHEMYQNVAIAIPITNHNHYLSLWIALPGLRTSRGSISTSLGSNKAPKLPTDFLDSVTRPVEVVKLTTSAAKTQLLFAFSLTWAVWKQTCCSLQHVQSLKHSCLNRMHSQMFNACHFVASKSSDNLKSWTFKAMTHGTSVTAQSMLTVFSPVRIVKHDIIGMGYVWCLVPWQLLEQWCTPFREKNTHTHII